MKKHGAPTIEAAEAAEAKLVEQQRREAEPEVAPGFQSMDGKLYANGQPFHVKGINWFGSETEMTVPGGLRERRMGELLPRLRAGLDASHLPERLGLLEPRASPYPYPSSSSPRYVAALLEFADLTLADSSFHDTRGLLDEQLGLLRSHATCCLLGLAPHHPWAAVPSYGIGAGGHAPRDADIRASA